jgi:hypothetical protein
MSGYDFKIKYKKGELNIVLVALSRAPLPLTVREDTEASFMMLKTSRCNSVVAPKVPEWSLYDSTKLLLEQSQDVNILSNIRGGPGGVANASAVNARICDSICDQTKGYTSPIL